MEYGIFKKKKKIPDTAQSNLQKWYFCSSLLCKTLNSMAYIALGKFQVSATYVILIEVILFYFMLFICLFIFGQG